jgi:hypothetical protein
MSELLNCPWCGNLPDTMKEEETGEVSHACEKWSCPMYGTPMEHSVWQHRAPSHEAELRELLSHAMEVIAPPPERNCSCHISPPCSDCVEWDGLREWFERANALLAKLDGKDGGK